MLPVAVTVVFSRIYNGVHYPGDVLAGAALGAAYGFAIVRGFNCLWERFGPRWMPLWHQRLPSLIHVSRFTPQSPASAQPAVTDAQWLRAGYLLIFIFLVARLGYLAAGKIELSEDEAYQWLWSKHLALSYYSKPPMIAYAQFLGTSLWGDTTFGVRFLSPVIAALLSFLTLRFLAREVSARVGFLAVVMVSATPLLAVGATLMTIDPLLVLFWTAAMIAGWRACQPTGTTAQWCWAGLWMGLAFLSKYTALFQWVCWLIFFALWPPARAQLRKPGPWLALLITLACTLPVLVSNAQHGWTTVSHVAANAGRTEPWRPTLRYFWDFLGSQAALLNPVFFLGMLWAVFAFWKRHRRDSLLLFFFSMGAPVYFGYLLFTSYKRVFPNWIAPAILPLLLLALVYWERRWREGLFAARKIFLGGAIFGLVAVVLLHDTNLIAKVAGRPLPATKDPLRRVRAWKDTARVVGEAREQLEAAEGKPAFIIGGHYGLTGEVSFYLPEGKAAVQSGKPLVYYLSTDYPKNQIYFWPEYRDRDPGDGVPVAGDEDPVEHRLDHVAENAQHAAFKRHQDDREDDHPEVAVQVAAPEPAGEGAGVGHGCSGGGQPILRWNETVMAAGLYLSANHWRTGIGSVAASCS